MRSLVLSSLLALASSAIGQATGLNFLVEYGHPLTDADKGFASSVAFGMGIQHDFTDRIGACLDVRYAASENQDDLHAWEVIYNAKYFTSENDGTAAYIGSLIGLQSYGGTALESFPGAFGYQDYRAVEISHMQFPVGLRAGVRGGLEGYFAEIYVQAGYAIGNGFLFNGEDGPVNSSPTFFGVGFSFLGVGWE
jgi:hypothetical protein